MVTFERRLPAPERSQVRRRVPIDPLVPVLMVIAFIIDFARSGSKSVWLDEAIGVSYARQGFGQFWQTVSHGDPNMSLYYLLLRPWIGVFGESESAVRSLSAVFAALAVGAIAVLGRRLFDRWTGLVAGLFLALNAFFVHYAQTARGYTLLVLLVVLSSYFFVVELERPSRGSAIGYVSSSTLAVYSHDFAVYVLLTQLLTLVAIKRRDALTRRWVVIGGSVVLLCAPEMVFTARAGTGHIAWIAQPTLHDLTYLPVVFLSSRALAFALVCLAAYAIGLRLRGRGAQDGRWQIGFVAAWFVVPILAAFAVSFSLPMFRYDYLLISLPGLLLAGAAGLVRLPSRIAGAVLLLLLVGWMGKEIDRWYGTPTDEDYRSAISAIRERAQAGDAIVGAPTYTDPAVAYYLRRGGSPTVPIANLDPGPTPTLDPQGRRVWVVARGYSPEETAQLYKALDRDYKPSRKRLEFRGLEVTLYTSA